MPAETPPQVCRTPTFRCPRQQRKHPIQACPYRPLPMPHAGSAPAGTDSPPIGRAPRSVLSIRASLQSRITGSQDQQQVAGRSTRMMPALSRQRRLSPERSRPHHDAGAEVEPPRGRLHLPVIATGRAKEKPGSKAGLQRSTRGERTGSASGIVHASGYVPVTTIIPRSHSWPGCVACPRRCRAPGPCDRPASAPGWCAPPG